MEELRSWNVGGSVFRAVLALTPEERAASFRLRYKGFVDCPQPRFSRENCADGLETDRFDAYSHHILIFRDDNPNPVGNVRLVDGSRGPFFLDGQTFSGVPFALPSELNGEAVRRESTCETGRWVGTVLKQPDGTRVLISRILLSAALELSQRVGFRHWIFAINSDAGNRARKDGFRLFPIVPGFHHFLDKDNVELCIMPVESYVFPVFFARSGGRPPGTERPR